MKALFTLARKRQPCVIFFDEIEALLAARKDGEHEASRRLKTEFLVQFDGATTSAVGERVLVLGATNLPWDLDEAVIRRLAKRIYIPLPDEDSRRGLIRHLLSKDGRDLEAEALTHLVRITHQYSGSDLAAVVQDAVMKPIGELGRWECLVLHCCCCCFFFFPSLTFSSSSPPPPPPSKRGWVAPEVLRTIKREDIRPVNLADFVAATRAVRPSVTEESLEKFEVWNRKQ